MKKLPFGESLCLFIHVVGLFVTIVLGTRQESTIWEVTTGRNLIHMVNCGWIHVSS